MNILVVDSVPPCDLLQGNALIGRHLFKRLGHHRLTLLCPAPADEIPRCREALAGTFSVIHLVPRARRTRALAGLIEPGLALLGFADGATLEAAQAFQKTLTRVLASDRFDVIHTRQLPMAAFTGPLDHPAKLIELVDSETLQSARRLSAAAPRSVLRYLAARTLESRAVRPFRLCTTVAEADARAVRALAPELPVRVVPNGVDAAHFAPLDVPEAPGTILFFGAMSFPPNVTAVLHFYNRIFPLIRREIPNARFLIAGRDPAPEVAALASDPCVTVTGYIDDLRPLIASAAVVICPMMTGSGIKNKVLEAMAMARPIVTTPFGVEAIDASDGRDVRVASTPAAFATAVVDLLRDAGARCRLGEAGRRLMLRRYSWEACAASYDEMYEEIAARGGNGGRQPVSNPLKNLTPALSLRKEREPHGNVLLRNTAEPGAMPVALDRHADPHTASLGIEDASDHPSGPPPKNSSPDADGPGAMPVALDRHADPSPALALHDGSHDDPAHSGGPSDPGLTVAYVMSRFPKLSETFVLTEMLAMERLGMRVEVFPLLNAAERVRHREAKAIAARAHYMPFLSPGILAAQMSFLARKPWSYLRVWIETGHALRGRPMLLLRTLGFLPKAVAFAREMEKQGVDHIHAHFATHPATAALVAHWLLDIPFSFTAHAHDLYLDQTMLREKIKEAAFVATISEFNKDFIAHRCGSDLRDKVHVVHCGADTSLFQPRLKFGRCGRFTIICVGTLEEKKGQRYLVEACRILKKRDLPFLCHMIGDGPMRHDLERQVEEADLRDEVRFAGSLPRAEVARLVSRADVVALPSIRTSSGMMEGIPVALMEALACETAVVSTQLSGIPELIEEGVTGLLVPPGDARALADALARLHGDSELRHMFGQAGREKVLRDFDLRKNAEKLAEMFREAAQPHPSPLLKKGEGAGVAFGNQMGQG
jgi:colanic acid/amylovoran biosynthesis glycosyltransferase